MNKLGILVIGMAVLALVATASAAPYFKSYEPTYEPDIAIQRVVVLDESGEAVRSASPGEDLTPVAYVSIYGCETFADYMVKLTVTTPSGHENTITVYPDSAGKIEFPSIMMNKEPMKFYVEGFHKFTLNMETEWKKDTQYTARVSCVR